MADPPDPPHSTITCLNLVGTAGGIVDPNAPVVWSIRDINGNPAQNILVTLDFSACVSQDIRLGATQPDPGTTVDCVAKTISKYTDNNGQVTWRIVGSANNLGNSSGHTVGCAAITAGSASFGSVTVSAFDQNLTGSVTSSDLSKFAIDFFGGAYRGRSDNNCTGTVTSADLSRFAIVFFGNGSTDPITYCP